MSTNQLRDVLFWSSTQCPNHCISMDENLGWEPAYTRTHTHTHTPMHVHAHMHTCTRTHTHTRTHGLATEDSTFFSFYGRVHGFHISYYEAAALNTIISSIGLCHIHIFLAGDIFTQQKLVVLLYHLVMDPSTFIFLDQITVDRAKIELELWVKTGLNHWQCILASLPHKVYTAYGLHRMWHPYDVYRVMCLLDASSF